MKIIKTFQVFILSVDAKMQLLGEFEDELIAYNFMVKKAIENNNSYTILPAYKLKTDE